jgi:hypothetical protein
MCKYVTTDPIWRVPFTDILWLNADDITIETAGGNGERHAQSDNWTDGNFLPGRPQHADTGMAR